jgi:hypothetical protein
MFIREDGIICHFEGYEDLQAFGLRLAQGVEDLRVEQFVSELAVQALAISILPRASESDEEGPLAEALPPLPSAMCSKPALRAMSRKPPKYALPAEGAASVEL